MAVPLTATKRKRLHAIDHLRLYNAGLKGIALEALVGGGETRRPPTFATDNKSPRDARLLLHFSGPSVGVQFPLLRPSLR